MTLLDIARAQIIIDPVKFGAVGNGITDDTDALSKAISYCESNQTTLKLGSENTVYLITKPLTIRKRFKLIGPGTLKKAKDTHFILLSILASNFVVDGIVIDGNLSEQKSFGIKNGDLMVINSSHITIKNSTFKNSAGNAVALFNSASCLISNNRIFNARDNAILIADGASNDNTVEKNYIDKTLTQNGIFITASSGSVKTKAHVLRNIIRNNTVKNAGDIGIESSINADYTKIYGNRIFNSKNDQIIIRDNVHNIVERNYCAGNGTGNGFAISVIDLVGGIDDYACSISNNEIRNARNAGILIAGNNVKAISNKIYGLRTGGGIGISVQRDKIVLKDNKIDGFGTGIQEFRKVSTKSYQNNKITRVKQAQQLLSN